MSLRGFYCIIYEKGEEMSIIDEKVWDKIYYYLDMMNLPYTDVGEKLERHIVLLYEDTQVHIVAGDMENIVFLADVIEDLNPNEELLKFLLTDGAEPFGNVSIGDNGVYMGYSLPAETLDFNIFATVLYQFSMYANWLGDEIKKRFGGKRTSDMVEDIEKESKKAQRRIGFK